MLDIRLIRERADFVRERLATRGGGDEARIDEVLRVDADRRKAETSLQQLNAERNKLSKEIGAKRSRKESSADLEAQVRKIGEEIVDLNPSATELDEQQQNLLLEIPNLPHESVPLGKDPSANVVVRSWGEKPKLSGKGSRSCCARRKAEAFRSGTRREIERQRFHLFHRRGREAGARADQFHARSAHARAWLHRDQSAVFGEARLHDRHDAAAEIRSGHVWA